MSCGHFWGGGSELECNFTVCNVVGDRIIRVVTGQFSFSGTDQNTNGALLPFWLSLWKGNQKSNHSHRWTKIVRLQTEYSPEKSNILVSQAHKQALQLDRILYDFPQLILTSFPKFCTTFIKIPSLAKVRQQIIAALVLPPSISLAPAKIWKDFKCEKIKFLVNTETWNFNSNYFVKGKFSKSRLILN